jgi:hypothetical protein
MRMLGWGTGTVFNRYIQVTDTGILPEEIKQAHPAAMSLSERIQELSDNAEDAFFVASQNGTSYEELDQLHNKVAEVRQLAAKARNILMDIDDELAKGPNSCLRVDDEATKKTGITHINIRSLERWAATQELQAPVAPASTATKPWLAPDLNDPPAEQDWYIPARSFARQLIREDTTLLLKKDKLAEKVVKSLSDVGIYKRGGKEPFNSGTVKKAFSNVIFK